MKIKESVRITSAVFAWILLGLCMLVWGKLSGFEKGYFYGVFQNPPHTGFSGDGPNFFQTVNCWYFLISVCLIIYIIAIFLKPLIVSSFVCLSSLSVAIYPFWDSFSIKYGILAMESKFSYDYWLKISVYIDWFCLIGIIILMLIQFTSVISNKLENKPNSIYIP